MLQGLGWAAWGLGVQQHGTGLGYVRGGGERDRGTARLHTCHGGGMHTCPCWVKTQSPGPGAVLGDPQLMEGLILTGRTRKVRLLLVEG